MISCVKKYPWKTYPVSLHRDSDSWRASLIWKSEWFSTLWSASVNNRWRWANWILQVHTPRLLSVSSFLVMKTLTSEIKYCYFYEQILENTEDVIYKSTQYSSTRTADRFGDIVVHRVVFSFYPEGKCSNQIAYTGGTFQPRIANHIQLVQIWMPQSSCLPPPPRHAMPRPRKLGIHDVRGFF